VESPADRPHPAKRLRRHPFFGFTMFIFWALIGGGCAMIATQTVGFVVG
jgi:hypothetical protein